MAARRIITNDGMVMCRAMIGRARKKAGLGCRRVVTVTRVTKMPRLMRGGVDPELCMAAGLSPLNTWTMTDADSVDNKNKPSMIVKYKTTKMFAYIAYFEYETIKISHFISVFEFIK